MSRRRLTDDERELWSRVARTTNRLQPGPSPEPDAGRDLRPDPGAPVAPGKMKPVKSKPPAPNAAPIPGRMAPFRPVGKAAKTRVDLSPTIGEHLAKTPVQMDRKIHRTMMRGKLEPEARIDLHGMTVAQAHQALIGFIMRAHGRGFRLVLVITGKGRTKRADDTVAMPARAGALKHEVPHWLRSGLLAPRVMDVRESHRSHGGAGAYYVYLRKPR